MELEQTYTFRTDTGTQNENRALTLSALQRIIVVISEEHLENIGLDVPHLMREYGVSWILLSISVDIKSPIRDGERLSVRTWHTEKREFISAVKLKFAIRTEALPPLRQPSLQFLI